MTPTERGAVVVDGLSLDRLLAEAEARAMDHELFAGEPCDDSELLRALCLKLREAATQVQALLHHCPDPECYECGEIICPHNEPLHFHHDGCPACWEPPCTD